MQSVKQLSAKTIALFAAAAILVITGGVNVARAALVPASADYTAEITLNALGIDLIEGNTSVSDTNEIMKGMLEMAGDSTLVLGKKYDEPLIVKNDTDADAYVRVTLYKYWIGDDGKDVTLDPALIEVKTNSAWNIDASKNTPERVVMYYPTPIAAGASVQFADSLVVDKELTLISGDNVQTTQSGNVLTTTYKYDGTQVGLKAVVDAVQTTEAATAIKSSWGVDPASVGIAL